MTGLVVLEKMGMLVLLMAVGFAAAKANWVGDGFNQATSRLVANVFLPASILSSVIGVAPLFSGKELAVVIAGTFVLFGLCAVGGLVVSKVVPMPKQDQLVAWLSIFFMNNVFVGFPVVQAIFGEEALFCASLTNIPFNILLFSIGVSRLRAGQGQGRVTIREVFSPGLIATLVAVVVFLFQIPVPSLLGDTIKSLANGTVPLSMIIIGCCLADIRPEALVKERMGFAVCALRLAAFPLLMLLALSLCETYELLSEQSVWGARMMILSNSRPREGIIQTLLVIAQLFALLIGAVSLLCAAAQSLKAAFPRMRLSLPLCALALLASLLLSAAFGTEWLLHASPFLLIPLSIFMLLSGRM